MCNYSLAPLSGFTGATKKSANFADFLFALGNCIWLRENAYVFFWCFRTFLTRPVPGDRIAVDSHLEVFLCMRDKVFWHEAFFEAIQLELHHYQDFLDFQNEHRLSKEALIMDVLIIKKKPGEHIDKNIGRIFREHNIFEFKSEKDSLSEQDYNKVVAYALLYSSFTPTPVSEISVSFSVTVHPRELLKYLENERGFKVQTAESGIYYVEGDTFPVQILESKLLSGDENLFLRNLRSNLSTEDVTKTAEAYKKLKPFENKNAYLDRLIQANRNIFKEAIAMSSAVRELFLEVAETDDWFIDRIDDRIKQESLENLKAVARKMILRGRPIKEIIEDTGLSREIVENL